MTTLDYTKISPLMTAKERVKLIIKIELNEVSNVSGTDKQIQNADQIRSIAVACPSDQAREYNFYIELKERIWSKILIVMESTGLSLGDYSHRISPLTLQMSSSPYMSLAIRFLEHMPVLVKQEDYKKGLETATQQIKQAVLEVDGKHGLAQEEAFYRLVHEGFVTEYDLLDEWLWWIGRYGKTEGELLKLAIESKKAGADKYIKQKERLSITKKEPFLFESYGKYVGMNDEELEKYTREHEADRLQIPDEAEYQKWIETVEEEKTRILQAVQDGELKWIKKAQRRYIKQKDTWKEVEVEGVEANSYYTWQKRYQKFAGEDGSIERAYNPLSEECIEMRYSKDIGVVFAADPRLLQDNRKSHPIGLFAPNNFALLYSYENQQSTIEIVKTQVPLVVKDIDHKADHAYIKFRRKDYRYVIKRFVENAKEAIQDIVNYIALVEQLEQEHLDGFEIAPRDPKHPLGVIPRVQATVKKIVTQHNEMFSDIVKAFNDIERGFWDCEFYKLDELLIPTDIKPNEEWLKKQFDQFSNYD